VAAGVAAARGLTGRLLHDSNNKKGLKPHLVSFYEKYVSLLR
jgi:hypothetical protein